GIQAALPLIEMRQNRLEIGSQCFIGDIHTPKLHRAYNPMADPIATTDDKPSGVTPNAKLSA
ncbi:MAG: hypothetical protein WAT32_11215, partial [Candidatus Microthrix parvicella]|nr:hypothetical protein [Candidatus Microthrix sp.]